MKIYTDASTRGKLSGLAYVATTSNNKEFYKTGITIDQPDNNTAELLAILFAIDDIQETLQHNEHITILTDSTYAINAIKTGKCRENEEAIVHKIKDMMTAQKCAILHVKGHCQDGTVLSYFNKRADKMSKVVRKLEEKRLEQDKKERKLLAIAKKALQTEYF